MKKVSIIVPIYNVENYLSCCLNSICKQSYENIEIILVNDGSTDSSLKICEEYQKKDKRIFVYTKKNGGLSDARNYGIAKSSGDYLCFLDSDDWIETTMIEKMLSKALFSNAQIVCCDIEYVYDNGEKSITSGGSFSEIIPENSTFDFLKIPPSACNKLFSRKLFENFDFPVGLFYEDLATIPVLMSRCDKIVKINEPLYKYRQRSGSIMHQETDKVFHIYKAIERIKENIPTKMKNKATEETLNELLIIHGLDLTTLRISSFQKNRILNYKKNIDLLTEVYPDWFKNPLVKKMGLKKFILFSLLKLNKYDLVDRILTRNYEN